MKDTMRYGIILGAIASVYLGVLAITGDHGGSALKYGKYVVLMFGLLFFFNRRVFRWTYEEFIARYIGSASAISVITGVVLVIFNTGLFFVNPDYSIQKYTLLPNNIIQLLTIDCVIIIETVVLGLLTSFVIFPYFKNRFMNAKDVHVSQQMKSRN
jgi:hypothetical protein